MGIKSTFKNCLRTIILLCKEKEMIPIPQQINSNQMLEGKVALITGGSSGIGFAIAEAFQHSGCRVVLAGRKEEILLECCRKIGGGVKYIVLDVNDVTSMQDKIKEAASLFEGRIDILVNSAGIVAKSDFIHMSELEYDTIMDTNTKGTFFMSQAMGKFMIDKKIKGHILNVTSSSALRPAWTPYQMSKWAVRGFTMGLADTLIPYGIVVNAIAPGPTATSMLGKKEGDSIYMSNSPSKRYAVPSEIAKLAVFMVSDMGNMIVGDTFYMTGGSGTITYHN